jgi:hypothetical protein
MGINCSRVTGFEVEKVTSPPTPGAITKVSCSTSPRIVCTTDWIDSPSKFRTISPSSATAAGAGRAAASRLMNSPLPS